MAIQNLKFITCLSRPNSARFVAACCDNLVSLGVKCDFTDLVLVPLQQGHACPSEDVVDSSHTVSTCGCQLIAGAVEAGVQDFVVVTTEGLDALSSADIPKSGGSIDTAS